MSANSPPLVSVCIPSYRGASRLGATLDSVLAQTLTDFELVVVDDASPDETSSVVSRYGDARVRFLRNPTRLGAVRNWNQCLAEATGTYLKLLPQDDILAPECLERQVDVMQADKDRRLALVCSARTIIDATGAVIGVRRGLGARARVMSGRALLRRCVRYGTNLIGEPGAVLFRRTLAGQVGSFSGRFPYVLDLEYWTRLLLEGDAHYLPETLAAFRVSASSWSVAIGRGQSRDFGEFISTLRYHPFYRVSRAEIILGLTTARINNLLRLLLYRVVVPR